MCRNDSFIFPMGLERVRRFTHQKFLHFNLYLGPDLKGLIFPIATMNTLVNWESESLRIEPRV